VEVSGGEKCERINVCVCVWYKEGQWRGSGIIWRGRCWNILSWITAAYTGETDGPRTSGRRGGGKRGGETHRDR